MFDASPPRKRPRVVTIDQPPCAIAPEHDRLQKVGQTRLCDLSLRRFMVLESRRGDAADDPGADVLQAVP